MKTLIIAEKPSLATEIAKAIGNLKRYDGYFLGEKYIVSFAFGHLMVLKDVDDYLNRGKTKWTIGELPFVPNNFEFKIRDDSGVKKQYKILTSLMNDKEVGIIVNAGDADREGEVIINNIINSGLKKPLDKKIERLWLKSINQEEIRASIAKMKSVEETSNLYREGLARTYLDWLYGINFTRYITLKSGTLLPVGRVLTPIVKKVYDRNKEIEEFIPVDYVELDVIVKKDDISLKTTIKNSRYPENKPREEIKLEVKELNKLPCTVVDKTIKTVEKKPKKLFSLTTLQNHLAKVYKLTLEETLQGAQELYEKGYLTYPRTNSEYLTNSEKSDVKKLIDIYKSKGHNLELKTHKGIFDDSKVESHSALLPTVKSPQFSVLSKNQQLVYKAVLGRFLSNFLIDKTLVEETVAKFKKGKYTFELKGNTIKQEGFYKYEKPDSKEKILPNFEIGELVDGEFIDADKQTQSPKSITLVEMNNYLKNPFREERKQEEEISDEKEYLEMLKGLEIGTVATRDSIIGNAVKYGYITEVKTVLSITDKGKYLIEALAKLNIDMSKEKTVETSIALKAINRNEISIEAALDEAKSYFARVLDKSIEIPKAPFEQGKKINGKVVVREKIATCPKCGRNIYESSKSFYCEGYNQDPICKFSLWKEDKFFEQRGKKLTKTMAKSLIKGDFVEVKNLIDENGNKFDASIKLNIGERYNSYQIKRPI